MNNAHSNLSFFSSRLKNIFAEELKAFHIINTDIWKPIALLLLVVYKIFYFLIDNVLQLSM
jgi:hypothetical protein